MGTAWHKNCRSHGTLAWRRRRHHGHNARVQKCCKLVGWMTLSRRLQHLMGGDEPAARGPSMPRGPHWLYWSCPALPGSASRCQHSPCPPAVCHAASKGVVSLQIEPQTSIEITAVVFFHTSKAIKRATSCIPTEGLI